MPEIAALFDVDGTLTSDNVWKGLMAFFSRRRERRATHGLFLATHYPLVVLRHWRVLSESTFRRLWARHLPWYFRGYDAAQMRALAGWVAREFVAPMARPEVWRKMRDHLRQGHVVALVSGAPTPIVQAIAEMWDVGHAIGSPAEFRTGRYTGGMAGEPCIDAHKAVYVRRHFEGSQVDVDYAASYAYADSHSDLGLFEMVGRPVAVHPDTQLAALAQARGWPILDG